jgi:ABC-type multidrug transport system fused ATPase/permease subunit
MAEDDKPKFDIPWATLLPIVAVLAGIIVQFRPLVSERPAASGEKAGEAIAEQDVDARLWQDPLSVAQKKKAEIDAEALRTQVPRSRVQIHEFNALETLVNSAVDDASATNKHILLLAVMLDSGSYAEQGESRLRTRQSVLDGLNESGFVPKDAEHIGFVTKPWPPAHQKDSVPSIGQDGELLIPWEEFTADPDLKCVHPPGTQRVFILWLSAASFNPYPLERFAALVRPFVSDRTKLEVTLIGPANSTGLQFMIQELRSRPLGPVGWARYDALNGVSIISARATAPAKRLLGESSTKNTEDDLRKIIEDCVISPQGGALHFSRTIATDDLILRKLIKELELREDPMVKADHVVILTEWDTEYARSLEKTFKREARLKAKRKHTINLFHYMHGIDGRLSGEPAKGDAHDDLQKPQPTQGTAATEATEGLDQSDFLRRLARELKDKNSQWRRDGDGGIRAIGLLGSDIYDKLMILRALRPEFRDAVFFTNNYDAHFERREDWSDVRNLVVASPFGSTLPPIKLPHNARFEQHVAPFRDNNQTSMFAGTLAATRLLDPDTVLRISRQPRMFEIGRRGCYELYQGGSAEPKNSAAVENARWFRKWLRSDGVWWRLILGAVALLFIVFWIGLSSVDRRLQGGGSKRERFKRTCLSTPFWLICGVPIIVLLVAYFSESGGARPEPLAFFSGISIWPAEMLRLIALLLAIHFMIKAHVDLRVNEREVTERFFPKSSPPSGKWHWRNPRLGLRPWLKEHPDWVKPDTPFSAKDAWSAYLVRNQFWPRFIRIGALFVIYFFFSVAVSTLFPYPVTPARGPAVFRMDLAVLYPAVIAMMILTFYVVDAIRLNSNFIRIFTYGVAKWEPDISLGRERIPPLDEQELSRYRNIFFVAQRTEAVAPLIWYPLIVLTMMFLARSSLFDNWTWPLSLILIFTLNAMWAIGSAAFLRRAAEQLRESAISNLQLLRVLSFSKPEAEKRRQTFDELIAEIRNLKKGAFAPLTEQPFVRAVLYPSGGLGLIAVAQRLLGSF